MVTVTLLVEGDLLFSASPVSVSMVPLPERRDIRGSHSSGAHPVGLDRPGLLIG